MLGIQSAIYGCLFICLFPYQVLVTDGKTLPPSYDLIPKLRSLLPWEGECTFWGYMPHFLQPPPVIFFKSISSVTKIIMDSRTNPFKHKLGFSKSERLAIGPNCNVNYCLYKVTRMILEQKKCYPHQFHTNMCHNLIFNAPYLFANFFFIRRDSSKHHESSLFKLFHWFRWITLQ